MAAWTEVAPRLDLDHLTAGGADVLPLLAYRLSTLGVDHPLLPSMVSIQRHTWYANQLLLHQLSTQLQWTRREPPVVFGQAATAIAYVPTVALRRIHRIEPQRRWRESTLETSLHGVTVRVPAPAHHTFDMLMRHWWVDAACAARHSAMDWDLFVATAQARGPALVAGRLAMLADIAGPETVPTAVQRQLSRRSTRAVRQFAVRSLLRARHRL
ncbi:MAG: hypothetical protein E6J14_13290 [Chloroflexi bacterium]|nr:MAG: hypothetical protein E6J14_13290 [Chloroflexota bacterium]